MTRHGRRDVNGHEGHERGHDDPLQRWPEDLCERRRRGVLIEQQAGDGIHTVVAFAEGQQCGFRGSVNRPERR